jgi:hypothetical protein
VPMTDREGSGLNLRFLVDAENRGMRRKVQCKATMSRAVSTSCGVLNYDSAASWWRFQPANDHMVDFLVGKALVAHPRLIIGGRRTDS